MARDGGSAMLSAVPSTVLRPVHCLRQLYLAMFVLIFSSPIASPLSATADLRDLW